MNKSKKFFQKVMALCLAFSFVLTVPAFAQSMDEGEREIISQKQIVMDDGTTAKETITKIKHPAMPFAAYERVTYEKVQEMTNFTVTLTATFSYSKIDKKVSCVSKSGKTSSSTAKVDSVTDTGSGSTCTVKLTYTYNNLGTPTTKSLSMKCDYNGNI